MSTLEPVPSGEHAAIGPAGVGAALSLTESRPHPGAVVLTACGQVDARTVAHLDEVLTPHLQEAVRCVVLDLSRVEFLGVDGLALLDRRCPRGRQEGARLLLVTADHETLRALHMGGLDTLVPVCASVHDALATSPGGPE